MKSNIRGFKNTLRCFYFILLTYKYKGIYSLKWHYFYLLVARDVLHFLLTFLMNNIEFRTRRLSSLYFYLIENWSESCDKIFFERFAAHYNVLLFSIIDKKESCTFSLSSTIIHYYIIQVRFMMIWTLTEHPLQKQSEVHLMTDVYETLPVVIII